MARKVIEVQYILRKERKVAQVEVVELANLAVESSQSIGDNREIEMVWIMMNNTSLGLQDLLFDSRASSYMFSE